MAAYMKGGHNAYRSTEPGNARDAYPSHVHHPVIVDSDGRKHEIIYAKYHNDQKYVTQTEQVIELRHRPGGGVAGLGLGGHNLNPQGKDGYKRTLVPWRTTHDRRDNRYESPTKAHGQGAVHEKVNKGSPRYHNEHNPKPPKYNDSSSQDKDRGSDYETDDVECKNGDCYPLVTTQPRNDASYPRPISNSPPPIKTRPNHNGRNFPEYSKPPAIKANPETIDSSEAKRRYGGVAVHSEKRPEPKQTIDCRAAAEKYDGIFVRGNNF